MGPPLADSAVFRSRRRALFGPKFFQLDEVPAKFLSGNHPRRSMDYGAAVLASFLGWMLDSFDFFLVVFCLTAIGQELHKSDAQIALSITVTLAFRPIGAFLFGLLADRFGRRLPLIINILFYSLAEVFTGLVHGYPGFMICRALFGIGMGGQWGVGVSLAMEKVPTRSRGVLSGLLQQGYGAGSILAALSYFFLVGRWGWRPLFFVGSLPALLLVLFIYLCVQESDVWERSKRADWRALTRDLAIDWKLLLYLSGLMMMMQCAAHGTQDMYPTFLERQWHLDPLWRSAITGFSGIGAIFGGVIFGYFSDKWGRRRAIIIAFILSFLLLPVWAYAPNLALLVTGAFLMQFMIQGAWGVIPAHLSELSPDSIRALLPGIAYQCGVLLSGLVVYIEAVFAQRTSYATAMALTSVLVFVLASVMAALGRERRGVSFGVRPRLIRMRNAPSWETPDDR
jgi:MFS transporter, SHS family, lactate transporter